MSTPKLKVTRIHVNDKYPEKHVERIRPERTGTARYNFVPLNYDVLGYDLPPKKEMNIIQDQSRYNPELLSGTLNCHLTTLSEIYVGSDKEGHFFRNVDGQVMIPGSSIRGLIREMLKVMSYGRLNQVDEKRRLYTRPMADKDKLFRQWYNDKLSEEGKSKKGKVIRLYKASAGYLYKDDKEDKYKIIPAQYREGQDGVKQYQHVKQADIRLDVGRNLKEFEKAQRSDGSWYVASGSAPKKKRDWLIYPPDKDAKKITLKDQDIENYRKDTDQANASRRKKIDLLKEYEENRQRYPQGIPVFYTQSNGHVTFGHTGLFRVGYDKAIGEHLVKIHTEEEKTYIDMAERIMGFIYQSKEKSKEKSKEDIALASLVRVEDAFLVKGGKTLPKRKVVLGGPKPTAFQNYLVQKNDSNQNMDTYNGITPLRGTKFWWHRPIDMDTFSEQSDTVKTSIEPIEKGSEFKFRVHFQNLTSYELGALLSVLELEEGLAHKIGMAKNLGYGSCRMSAELTVYDTQKRYEKLFQDSSWHTGKAAEDKEKLKADFKAMVHRVMKKSPYENDRNAADYWGLYRMRQLKKMLDVAHGNGLSSRVVRDQDFAKESRDRKILPIPEKV